MTYSERPYDLCNPERPICTRPRFLPVSKVHEAHTGKKVRISNIADRPDSDTDSDNWVARDGLMVVKNATIPDGTEI